MGGFYRFSMAFLAALALLAAAWASMVIPANDNAKEHSQAPVHSPAIGANWDIERVDFVHYAKPSNPGKPSKTDTCYKLMGVKWAVTPVHYAINPENPQSLGQSFITNAISTSAETWDDATSKELAADTYGIDTSAQYGTYDSKNSIVFGSYPQSGVIAVTSIWYSKRAKQIVEFDMLFNTYYRWGDASANPYVMDLQNIATHEMGHAFGLSDIYSTSCTDVTMYGYSNNGETSKRTLEQPDITGLQAMYGQ